MYDNAPSHRKRAPNALSAFKMRKGVGLKCASVPEMRDTVFYCEKKGKMVKQTLVHKGKDKGDLKTNMIKGAMMVGYERGLWDKEGKVEHTEETENSSSKKRKQKMRSVGLPEMKKILADQPDFKLEPSLLQVLHNDLAKRYASDFKNPCYGKLNACHDMIYAPKFHCELQEKIERAWSHSKAGCCKDCTYSITGESQSFAGMFHSTPHFLFVTTLRIKDERTKNFSSDTSRVL